MHEDAAVGRGGRACEVCGTTTVPLPVGPGDVLDACPTCGHLHRDLVRCPARHRDLAYGGDPGLDRVRLALTHRALVEDGAPASVFEIGFGAGALLRRFLDAGARVGGADPDQLGVAVDPEVARHGRLWSGGVETVPDDFFTADLVAGVHVVEHVPDPLGTLRTARSLLAPGGRAVFVTPAADSSGLDRYGASWWMLEDPTHVRFFTARSLEKAARRAGFTRVRVDRLLLDSLSVDVASLGRRYGVGGGRGALSSRALLAAAAVTAPVVVGVRALAPRSRAALRLTASVG